MRSSATVGRLLESLRLDGGRSLDVIAQAAAVSVERIDRAIDGDIELSLSEQLRLAEAVMLYASHHGGSASAVREELLGGPTFATAPSGRLRGDMMLGRTTPAAACEQPLR